MPIRNSIRNVLTGMGTSGMRGGTVSGTLGPPPPGALVVNFTFPVSSGKWRLKIDPAGGQITRVDIIGLDAVNTSITLYSNQNISVAGVMDCCGDFQSDLDLIRIQAMPSASGSGGSIDFEVWGQANSGGG